MRLGLLQIELFLPACNSLKEKRSIVKRCINLLRKNYNVSVSEMGMNDEWRHCFLGIVIVNSSSSLIDRVFGSILKDLDKNSDIEVENYEIETF